jgi:undecaprenyl-diphosphatase
MSWLQVIVLGLLQGITEFLPVSSTAHMDIASKILYHQDVGSAFSAIAQLGPIFAIVLFFRSDLARYVKGILRTRTPANLAHDDTDARMGWFVLLGTLPLAVFALLLEKKVDTTFRRYDVVAVALIVLALILLWAERVGARRKGLDELTLQDSQVVGWAQVLALIPGASRSGTTITAGLFRGLDRESAARFSFLLSIPAITAAGLYKLGKAVAYVLKPSKFTPEEAMRMNPLGGALTGADVAKFVVAALVAGLFAYGVIRWFLGYMQEHDTRGFIIYRIVLGVVILALLQMHVLKEPVPHSAAPAGSNPAGARTLSHAADRLALR